MKKLVLFSLIAFILQSCGFQHRKYTTGYYGRFHQDLIVSPEQDAHQDLSSNIYDSILLLTPTPTQPQLKILESPDSYANRKSSTVDNQEEHLDQALTSHKTTHSPIDTLKLRFGHKEKNKSEFQPPQDILEFRNKRRWDSIFSVFSFVLSIIFLLALQYGTDAFWGVIGASSISIWLIIRTLRDGRRLKKLMRKKNCEDQDKKWFIQQEKRSGIAAFFAFTFVAMLGISLMFLVVATLIGLNAF